MKRRVLMRYFKKAFLGVLAGLVIFSGAVFAQEFRGKILQIDQLAEIIVVEVQGEPKKPSKEMLVNIKEKMKLEGIKSTEELSKGDEILFDASESMFGTWSFNSIKKLPRK